MIDMPDTLQILYRSSDIVCCIKDPGVLSEDPGLPALIRDALGISDVFCVHRLDREAGGVMVYALNKDSAAALSAAFSPQGTARKTYLAVIEGSMEEKSGDLNDLLFHDSTKNKSYVVTRRRRGVREASLSYETVSEKDGLSLIRIDLHSGRTHQIRVQFSSRRHPLLGDRRYGSTAVCSLALWSYEIGLFDASDEGTLSFSSLPPDCYPWDLFSGHLNSLSQNEE